MNTDGKKGGVPTMTLPSDREVLITCMFDAPRDLVFKAYTDPDLIPQWWGPKRFATTVDKMDVRPGGAWRFVHRGPGGEEHGFRGRYVEVKAPERLVLSFEYEGMPGHVSQETMTFEELNGQTKLTNKSVFPTVEDRDGMLNSGMEQGMIETMGRLAELLAELEIKTK